MSQGQATLLDTRALRAWPLPMPDGDADKEDRGRIVIVAGSREIAGAAVLAGIAALRAGAGKLVIATARSVAPHVAQSVPEARVIALDENASGSFRETGFAALESTLHDAAALLVGPGMMDPDGSVPFVARVLHAAKRVPCILDAAAMDVVNRLGRFEQPVLLTPHAGEMAHLMDLDKAEVLADPDTIALEASRRWNAVVALKNAVTHIATPQGQLWRHEAHQPGLATSGSGDVLSGLVGGFAARGATLEQACAWGVVVHARAGAMLARDGAPLGYLARELNAVAPRVVARLSRRASARAG